jgi:hypothetical protein
MTEHDATHGVAPHRPLSDSVPPEEPRTPVWLTTVGLVLLLGLVIVTARWLTRSLDPETPSGTAPAAEQANGPVAEGSSK